MSIQTEIIITTKIICDDKGAVVSVDTESNCKNSTIILLEDGMEYYARSLEAIIDTRAKEFCEIENKEGE